MGVSRRTVLRGVAAGALGAACKGGEGPAADPDTDVPVGPPAPWLDEPVDTTIFAHGVASGDPWPDSVVLWTRVSGQAGAVDVDFIVATREGFDEASIVAEGTFTTDGERDFTVKPVVSGLPSGATLYYAFFLGDARSVVGRTRTAPDGPVDRVRLGVCSCAQYTDAPFDLYRDLSLQDDLNAVLHLGDYIYEYPRNEGKVRHAAPDHEIVTLEDYRTRYAAYREDPDLQACHAAHPFVVVWDDHEITNDAWRDGAQNHQSGEGPWDGRKLAAVQAYVEWLQIRVPDAADPVRIWRALSFGDLVDVFMLDTRLYGRDARIDDATDRFLATDPLLQDPRRQMLGVDQEAWLFDGLRSSTTTWRVLGNQVPFAPWRRMSGTRAEGGGKPKDSGDKWDGYAYQRDKVYDVLAEVGDCVIVTGDIHRAQAIDVVLDPDNPDVYDPETGEGAVAVELITTSIATSGIEVDGVHLLSDVGNTASLLVPNPHHKMVDSRRGFLIVEFTSDKAVASFHARVADQPDLLLRHRYTIGQGANHLGPDEVDQG